MDNQEEQNKRLRQGRISKELGINAEKKFAKMFRDAGWIDAIPMRQVSKLKDDRKLDLYAVPVNAQIKAGSQRNMNIRQVLRSIKEAVAKLPPHYPEHDQHAVLIHSQDVRSSEFDDIVSMTFQDYFKLLCMLHDKGVFRPVVTILNSENNIIPPEELK